METLLDLQAMDPAFDEVFGEPGMRQQWFQQMLQSALVATVTGAWRCAVALELSGGSRTNGVVPRPYGRLGCARASGSPSWAAVCARWNAA